MAAVLLAAVLLPAKPAVDATAAVAAAVPAGFTESTVFSGLTNPTAVRFSPDGRVFVAEKSGLIKVFASLTSTTPTVVADLRTNVHNFWDRGLLGMVLSPTFPTDSSIYVLYTYDHVLGSTANPPRWGTADATSDTCPNPPGATVDGCVVSGRLSRLDITGNTWVGPEHVLIEDWCQQFPSHSVGSLAFGADGMLYVSGGDGASFNYVDYGQTAFNVCGDPPVPFGTAQSLPSAEGGALRAQATRGSTPAVGGAAFKALTGAILRVDPVTGAAAAGNPNSSSSDPNIRRIVAYGLRNPFRITVRPGTNEVWVGDVGWNTWEEINVVANGGDAVVENFGWPCYEGNGRQAGYDGADVTLCESLYSQGASAITAPRYTYNHANKVVTGETCTTGSSSLSGVAFYPDSGGSFPAAYQGGLFFSDYSRNCIWFMPKGSNGLPNPGAIQTFVSSAAGPVDVVIGPGGDLFYPDFNGGTIRRVRPTSAPQSPTARIVANPTSGTAPLTVQFDGATSSDPGNLALTYAWDLDGDGQLDDSTAVAPSWQYTQGGQVVVTLRVTNTSGATGTATQQITVNATANNPPQPTIATPQSGTTWAVGDTISFNGSATDTEDGQLAASRLSWRFVMHHCPSNCHTHDIETQSGIASGSFVAPDHEYPSFIEVVLIATDSAGASASTSVNLDPRTVALTFQSVPTGLQLVVGGTSGTAPFSRTVVQGSSNSVSAPSPQVVSGTTYTFSSWSDGGAASHNITAGTSNATYTATFTGSAPVLADISVTKTGSPGSGGKTARFTMVVRNTGPSSASRVSLSDVLPGGTSFGAASSTAGTCAYNTGSKTLTCAIGTMTSGASVTVTLDVSVNGRPKSLANTATVSSTTADPNASNNSSRVTVRLK
jgi:uncharacterized repeat protein (TIGR01451 family)